MAHVSHCIRHRFAFYPFRRVSFILKMPNKRRRCFSIAEKVEMLERSVSGVSNNNVWQELGISQSTLSTIWKSNEKL